MFERCTPHAIRALDDLGAYSRRVDAAALTARPSAYGRTLLIAEGSALPGRIGTWVGTDGRRLPIRLLPWGRRESTADGAALHGDNVELRPASFRAARAALNGSDNT